MDAGDRRLFAASLQKITGTYSGEALDAALADLGWAEALDDDRSDAVSLLFELQGMANATSGSLDVLMGRVLGADVAAPGVLLPRLGTYAAPADVAADRLTGQGLVQRRGGDLVVATSDCVFAVSMSEVAVRPAAGMDPDLGLAEVFLDVPLDALKTVASGISWPAAASVGQLAIAHEIVGACRAMLELARKHALEREQFGRPISQFQAIRHRLAESLVAIEAADSALSAAWEDGSIESARYAKAIAGSGARTVARHAQQVLAGMGYTTEHPFHRYLRRVLVLDQLLGASRTLTREIGQELMQGRAFPLLPL